MALNFMSLRWNRFSQLLQFFVATISQSGSFSPFHTFSFIHCRFLMVCLPSMELLITANKVNCLIYVLNYVLLIKIVQTIWITCVLKIHQKHAEHLEMLRVLCCIKRNQKRFKNCSYLHSLIFSAVNTDSETAVVNVTYETREQARQWVNFALKFFFSRVSPNAIAKILTFVR